MEDSELYQLLQTDPELGMRECIAQYYALVAAICKGILPHAPQDAEECVNESFLRLWQTLDTMQNPAHLRAYLCMIARNRALSVYRKNRAAAQRSEELPPPYATFCTYFWDAINPAEAVQIGFEKGDTVITLE